MTSQPNLEEFYVEATQALRTRDYERAGILLKQILVVDENYKNASRLLAQVVKLKRRRWYNHPFLWGVVGAVVMITLGFWLTPKLREIYVSKSLVPTVGSTASPAATSKPTNTKRPNKTPVPTPTPIPLAWKRISIGQEFPRDNITAIVVNPKDPDVLYVGTDNAGIYKSVDGGLSWRPAHDGLGTASVYSLVIDPTDPNILYAGLILGGVYKTLDGGDHWREANRGINSPKDGWEWISLVIMDHQNSRHLYYTHAFDGIFETKNGGASWNNVQSSTCPQSTSNLIMHPDDPKILYATNLTEDLCRVGVYQSKDSGKTWELIQPMQQDIWFGDLLANNTTGFELNSHPYGCDVTVKSPVNNQIIYCGKNNTLLRSIDKGNSWEEIADGLGNASFEIILDPVNPSVFYGESKKSADGGYNLYRSTDSGASWISLTDYDCNLDIDVSGTLYCWGWFSLYQNRSEEIYWDSIHLPADIQTASVNPYEVGEILVQASNQPAPYVYLTIDAGSSWQETSGIRERLYDTRFYFHNTQDNLVYAVTNHEDIYRSLDNGISWSLCDGAGWYSRSDSRFAIDPNNVSRLFLASQGSGVLLSTDDCTSWNASNDGLDNLFVNTLAIDPNNPNTVYAGTDGGAYVSFDGGQTWGEINDGLLGATVVYSIVVDKDSNVYAATPYGIFKLERK